MTTLANRLWLEAVAVADMPRLHAAGVYAFWLKTHVSLPHVVPGENGLLYVGMTSATLDGRNHVRHANSGFSTFRRSLGALLVQELALVPRPRSAVLTRNNTHNYRFDDAGEARLTSWMIESLIGSQVALDGEIAHEERQLIALLQPPLNLTLWPNPQKGVVQEARVRCRERARTHTA